MSEISRRRPWLAVLLALVISGLGHAYLRRWARAFGWYVAITATVVLFVPDAAVDSVFAGDPPPVPEIAPAVAVVAASVVDAYVVAVRNNRKYERQRRNATAAVGERQSARSEDASQTANGEDDDPASVTRSTSTEPVEETGAEAVSCPHCGRESDPEFDFCQWCAEPIDG